MKFKCKCGKVVMEGEIIRNTILHRRSEIKGIIIQDGSREVSNWVFVCFGCQRENEKEGEKTK